LDEALQATSRRAAPQAGPANRTRSRCDPIWKLALEAPRIDRIVWIRDRYLLAVLIVAAVSIWGDAFDHIHQEAVNDNHDPDNAGPVLHADILFPLVPLLLYAARERLRRLRVWRRGRYEKLGRSAPRPQ